MNKEEIKHFKSLLRQGSLRHMNILLDDKFQKELQIIIKDYEKLQKENQELKKQLEEINKLNNVINELEKWLNNQTMISLKYEIGYYKEVLDKLKELKENKYEIFYRKK